MTREQVLTRLRERIVAFAASRLGRDSAEDLAQEVLVVLQERYASVNTLEELVPLSIQIVRFKIAALRRKTVRRGEHTSVSVDEMPIPDERPDPAQQAERREFLERLNTAAAQLGDRCKEMLRMKLQGLSFPEIQKVLGVRSINTIYTWDHRCRQHLLELLERKR